MGKRKAPVPHRRVGAHFVDLPAKRLSLSAADTARMRAALGATPPSSAVAASLPESGGDRPPDAGGGAGDEPQQDMHVQHPPQATAPHLQHGKPIVTTVPLRAASSPMKPVDSPLQPVSTASPTTGDTVTMTVAELNAWKQRTVFEIEDHFTNEQLKRIAEFGRVHANLLKEAKEYVFGIETQLKEQFERERESLRSQAEAYVAQFQEENEQLRAHVEELEAELHEYRNSSVGEAPAALTDTVERVSAASNGSRDEEPGRSSSPLGGEDAVSPTRLEDVTETMNRAMGLRTPLPAPKPTTVRVASGIDLP